LESNSAKLGDDEMFQGSKSVAIRLMILLLAFVSSKAMSFGQSATPPVTYTYTASVTNQTTVNNCSVGEPVALNGTVQFSYQVTTDSNGVNHFTITAANNLTGLGQTTSTSYVASDSSDYYINSSQASAEATVELKSDLVSQGSAPNLSLVQALHVTLDTAGNISAEVVDNVTQCGN
jgi:hypothetical protein